MVMIRLTVLIKRMLLVAIITILIILMHMHIHSRIRTHTTHTHTQHTHKHTHNTHTQHIHTTLTHTHTTQTHTHTHNTHTRTHTHQYIQISHYRKARIDWRKIIFNCHTGQCYEVCWCDWGRRNTEPAPQTWSNLSEIAYNDCVLYNLSDFPDIGAFYVFIKSDTR